MSDDLTTEEAFAGLAAVVPPHLRRPLLKHFTLTDDHVKLLRAANVTWNGIEFGAPGIDPKRPYGNSSGIEVDIALTLGWEVFEDADEEPHLTREQHEQVSELHEQTETALQVVLRTGSFTPGEYVADQYDTNWRLVRPVGEGSS